MRNSLKALIATSGGAFLLLGGAGSLAYWQSAGSVPAGDLQSGRLALTDAASSWTLNGVTVADPTAVRVVPGDELAWTGGFLITAQGDNLQAEIAMTGGQSGGTLAPYVTTDVSWDVAGEPASSPITSADDGKNVDVLINVDFPFSAGNASQAKTLDVSDVSVTLTQVDATPAA